MLIYVCWGWLFSDPLKKDLPSIFPSKCMAALNLENINVHFIPIRTHLFLSVKLLNKSITNACRPYFKKQYMYTYKQGSQV